MKIFLDFLGVLLSIVFNSLFGYGITITLLDMNAPIALIVAEIIMYFISAIVFAILTLYGSYVKRKGISNDRERNLTRLKSLSLVVFVIPFLVAMMFNMIKQHAPIVLVVFIIVTLAGFIPILRKQIIREYNYCEARSKGIKWALISITVLIAFILLTKIMSIPVDKWRF